jgi:hypothetical protein
MAEHLVDGGISILQYVDDTVLFIQDDMDTFQITYVCV